MNQTFQIESSIPLEMIVRSDGKEYIEHIIKRMKEQGAIEVFEQIYKSNHPIVVETYLEEWNDPSSYFVRYRLHYLLTAVPTRNVVWAEMPPLTFTNHEGKIEWKCRACGIINPIEATFCGEKHRNVVGCGHPREKVRQEM